MAFISETAVFLYLGFSVFVYHQKFNFIFTISSIVINFQEISITNFPKLWCLLGRAANIFPLAWLCNKLPSTLSVDISMKNQIVMWFSGLRGAIAFVLCLDFPVATSEVVTSTLTIVLATICLLGNYFF